MSEAKYRDWILDTIDSLRSRKARPDLERICRMVRRRHGSEPDKTCLELEKLIQEQTVLKVNYKGSISYRNAAKVQRSRRKTDRAISKFVLKQIMPHDDSASSPTDENQMGDTEEIDHLRDPVRGTSAGPTEHDEATTPTDENDSLECLPMLSDSGSSCSSSSARVKPSTHACKVLNVGSGTTLYDQGRSANNGSFTSNKRPSGSGDSVHVCEKNDIVLPKKAKTTSNGNDASMNPAHKSKASSKPKLRIESHTSTLGEGDRLAHFALSGTGSIQRDHECKGRSFQSKKTNECSTYSENKCSGKVSNDSARERDCCRTGNTDIFEVEAKSSVRLPHNSSAEKDAENMGKISKSSRMISSVDKEAPKGTPITSYCHGASHPSFGLNSDSCPSLFMTSATFTKPQASSSPEAHKHYCSLGVIEHMQPGLQRDTAALERLPSAICPSAQRSAPSRGEAGPRAEESALTPDQLLSADCSAMLQQNEMVQITEGAPQPGSAHAQDGKECYKEVDINMASSWELDSIRCNGIKSGSPGKRDGIGLDPLQWTVADVASYLTAVGFPEQAVAFRTQEIDGRSLLLMQRSDVLTGLSIKLGPALKIYERHVKVLQRRLFKVDCTLCSPSQVSTL